MDEQEFEASAAQSYRTMIGADRPIEERARRARSNAARTPLTGHYWRLVDRFHYELQRRQATWEPHDWSDFS